MTRKTPRPIDRCRRAWAAGLRPDDLVWADEWAAKNRVLPMDTPEPGPYRPYRTPYTIDIQRTMSPASDYSEGWWQKPVQAGGSVSGENLIATWVCAAAGSMLVIFPTLGDGQQWELTRFEPLRAGTRELRRRIRAAAEKGSDNTKLRKKYPGGVMRIVGANKPIKSTTARYVKFEEPDDYPKDVAGQGSVIDQARARTKNFGRRRKMYGDGTPTDEHSEICKQAARGDQRHWLLYCPDCRHPQRLVWEQLRCTVEGDPSSVRYACVECGTLNDETAWKVGNYQPRPVGMTEEQAAAAGLAHWVKTAVGQPGVASWTGFNSLCLPQPWRPWPDLWQAWLDAKKDENSLKVFYNNELALPYTIKVGTSVAAGDLAKRAERYELMTCPAGGLIACASVDVQDNRLEVLIRCWGRGEESWATWYDQLWGDPSQPKVWRDLAALLEAPLKHENGQTMYIDAALIDAGGHNGEEVYAFCRDAQLRGKQWHAIRGAKDYYAPRLGKPRPVEFTYKGVAVPGGATFRYVGTQSIKNLIDGRLKIDKPGGGYYHFPLQFPADYYTGLRVETREWRQDSKGRRELWWINKSGNEPWDLEVYNYACFLLCMQGQHAETVWRAREKLFGRVQQMDLLDDGAPAPVQTPASEAEPAVAEPEADDSTEPDPPPQRVAPPAPPALARHVTSRPKPRRGFVSRWQ